MISATSRDQQRVDTLVDEPEPSVTAEVVLPAAEPLDRDEVRRLVGAKNVMGTCSG